MSDEPSRLSGSERKIDARSIVTLITFFVVNGLVIYPLKIPLPNKVTKYGQKVLDSTGLRSPKTNHPIPENPARRTTSDHQPKSTPGTTALLPSTGSERWYFPLDLRTIPVLGVLLLLASTCIPSSVVRDGIVGSSGVRPYDILTLFISFAYISLSLDCTGLLRYLAFLVATRSSTSGVTLYNAFYAFFALTGLIVGNDPLILSGTPFLSYFTDHAGIKPPTAFLFTHFQVSNLVSALLVSSNPTNLVLTSSFGLSFLRYSAWMALPTIAALVILYPVVRWVFRGMIPIKLNPPKVDPRSVLVDPWGGVFGAALFVVTIVLLVGLSAGSKLEGVQGVWTVTGPAALIMLARDCWWDMRVRRRKSIGSADDTKEEPKEKLENHNQQMGGQSIDGQSTVLPVGGEVAAVPLTASPSSASNQALSSAPTASEPTQPDPLSSIPPLFQPLAKTFPTATLILTRLPLPLVPFAFSMFILVEALQYTGWISVFAKWWTSWIRVGGVGGSIWLMGTIGVLGCNMFGTNIGATILLSRVLQQWQSTAAPVSDRELYGAVFALAVGSNFGAYSFVFPASLAGLLWRNILEQKGLAVSNKEFVKWNWIPLFVSMIVGCLVVAGEVCVMYES